MRFLPLSLILLALALLLPVARFDRPRISGRVLDEDGTPVVGAIVRVKGTAVSTSADREGRFVLPRLTGKLTAWKDGYFIAGGRSPLRLERLPNEDNESYEWTDPTPDPTDEQRCGNCHAHIQNEWSHG